MYSASRTRAKLVYLLDQLVPQNCVADILITAERTASFNGPEFAAQYNKFQRNTLRTLFKSGVSVITRSTRGRLHSHTAVLMHASHAEFDWYSFDQSEHYYNLYTQTRNKHDLQLYAHFLRKYRRSLSPEWQHANRVLMRSAKRHGLGRVFMTPVRKNMQAYKWYVVGNLPKRREHRDAGIHYLRSWGLESINGFQPINKHTVEYRRKLAKFCTGLQLTSEDYNIYLRNALGRRWYYKVTDLVRDIDNLTLAQQQDYHMLRQTLGTYRLRTS